MPANTDNPCLLAMDTSTGPCSVAVWKNGTLAAYVETLKPSMQSASLMPMVEQALSSSGVTYSDLSAVVATTGPGSFTGIRVALSAARAISYAANVPVMGYTSLEVLAFAAHTAEQPHALAILNAGKGECYYQYYSNDPWQPAGEPSLAGLDAILAAAPATSSMIVSGNMDVSDPRFIPCGVRFARADYLAQLAAEYPASAQPLLRPFYIRPPDAKLPQPKPAARA